LATPIARSSAIDSTIGGEFSSGVSTTRESHAPVSKYEDAPEVQLSSRRPDLGVLKPGAAADPSILAIEDGEFPLEGVRGEAVEATRRIFARGAVVGGEWWPSA